MPRSFSSAKLVSAAVARAITGRGFSSSSSSAAQGGAGKGGGMAVKKAVEDHSKVKSVSWVPDPQTGFYRPQNDAEDVLDAANQRALHLNKY